MVRITPAAILGLVCAGLVTALGLSVVLHPIPLVFMLHSIQTAPEDPLDVSPGRFKEFVETVSAGRRPALFTTDSSDRSIYEVYAAVLEQHRQAALVFLMPPVMGRPGMLTWEQVREMAARGTIFGSHTLTHPWLPDLSDEELRCELCDSKRRIEEQLGHRITAVAYPYGAFNDEVRRVAVLCGYTEGYATAPGRKVPDDDRLAIKRVPLTESLLRTPFLGWLAASEYYVTVREYLLWSVPIDVPRKPADWSYSTWQRSVKPDAHTACLIAARSPPKAIEQVIKALRPAGKPDGSFP
jgi:peptidoglycan/xylan/chitin deacetylase (PgdA/CDA1 family)